MALSGLSVALLLVRFQFCKYRVFYFLLSFYFSSNTDDLHHSLVQHLINETENAHIHIFKGS